MAEFHPVAALVGRFYAERNREYPLSAPVLSVGRSRENVLCIPDARVAATHVRIHRDDPRYTVEAVAAEAPTRLNGLALAPGERRDLADGDVLCLSELEFRFVYDAAAGARTRLRVLGGVHRGKLFRIDRDRVALGRAPDNDIQFPDRSVSRYHCRLWHDGFDWLIEDLGSTNGTLVNNGFLWAPARLRDGDQILAGFSRFVFQTEHEADDESGYRSCA